MFRPSKYNSDVRQIPATKLDANDVKSRPSLRDTTDLLSFHDPPGNPICPLLRCHSNKTKQQKLSQRYPKKDCFNFA